MTAVPTPEAAFPLTRWSLILSSRDEGVAVLEEICRLYRAPLYAFCRRSGLGNEDAEDVTQRFFHDLVRDRAALLAHAAPEAGRLRTLFLRVLQRRIADHHRHAGREKRGGGQVVSLDGFAGEAGASVVSGDATSEQDYDRQWALNVLQLALARHERDFSAAGRAHHHAAMVPFLGLAEAEPDYAEVQRVLSLSDVSARLAVRRFRDRFRRHLREEIAETLACADEAAIDAELEELRGALRR